LEIVTNSSYPDTDQAYYAGLLEGLVTSDLIKMHWHNTLAGYCTEPLSAFCQRLKAFVDANFGWVNQMIGLLADIDPYFHQVRLFLLQLQGLIDGYKFSQSPHSSLKNFTFHPDIMGLLLFQIGGDLGDLENALKLEGKVNMVGESHCSAIIKLTPGNKDLLSAQNTWSGYNTMLRILKKYSFGFHLTPDSHELIAGQNMTFSSYPGVLLSGDDFYVISSGLVAMETTIGNSNNDLWQNVQPLATIFEGIRNVVANRLATSGKQWTDLFSKFNMGTYNNQWMVVDYKRFAPGSALLNDGLLYIVEQIPGIIKAADVTNILQSQTYWPSYNIPYNKDIFNANGSPELVAKFGDWFTYDKNPRALIFRRDHSKVIDAESLMKLMRYNDYTHDPLSQCKCSPPYSAENAISARCDLNPVNGSYPFGALGHRSHGGLDAKLTTSTMVKSLEFVAVGGPTYDQLPPFQWSKSDYDKTVSHVGHPDLWMFKPIQHKWNH